MVWLRGCCQGEYRCYLLAESPPPRLRSLKRGLEFAKLRSVDSGQARGAVYYDEEGNLHEQLARVVVICANGIGTPRLLLNSKSKLFHDGLANSSGLVGRGCMLHAGRGVRGIFSECMDGYLHSGDAPFYSQQFHESNAKRGFARGHSVGHECALGRQSSRRDAKPLSPYHSCHRHWEDLPDEDNRVELDFQAKDSNSVPAPRVVYSFSENTRRMQQHGAQSAREFLQAAGATEIHDEEAYPWTSHFTGTARMGNSPKTSVVNAWNQAHDVPNLFMADGSFFRDRCRSGADTNHWSIGLALRRRNLAAQGRMEVRD